MTISQDPSAPLFVVVGSTGVQGGSVIQALRNSSNAYRVRALTRDPLKESSKALSGLGCEVVQADVNDLQETKKAFRGANFVFAMTESDYLRPEQEYNVGKTQVDAAKAESVPIFVWAGVSHLGNLSGNKIRVDIFDVKAEVTEYARSIDGWKVIDVQPPSYASNYTERFTPRRQEDGTFVLALPLDPSNEIPIADMVSDYGKYVVGAIEKNGPETVYAAPEYLTPLDMAQAFAKVSGKVVTFRRQPDEVLQKILEQHRGKNVASAIVTMFQGFRTVGYYGGADLSQSNSLLSEPAKSFEQYLKENKNLVAKIFA